MAGTTRTVPPPIGNYCSGNDGDTYPSEQSQMDVIDFIPRMLGTDNPTGDDFDNIPNELAPGVSTFGQKAATEPMFTEEFDGFEIMDTCLEHSCGVEDNCPFDVPGLLRYEIEHVIFRTAALFKTSWGEVGDISGACTIID